MKKSIVAIALVASLASMLSSCYVGYGGGYHHHRGGYGYHRGW